MKDVIYKGRIIKQSDVKKLRCFRKNTLDNTDDYSIYLRFLRLMASDDYRHNCKGIYLLNYMKNGDDYFFYNRPSKYENAL